jgi:hypothetical protein
VASDKVMVEGLRLRSQLQVAKHDLRAVQVKMTSVVNKLVVSQKGIISMRAAVAKKKEKLMTLKLEQLKLIEAQNSILLEQTALEEERVERQTISVDTLGRLTGHLLGATSFRIVDVRPKQEIQMEGKLAMQQAKSEALLQEELGGLEESRKKLTKEIIRKEQVAKDQAAKREAMLKAE